MYALLGIIGGTFGVLAYMGYFRAIFRGTTKPHLYTWILWGTLAFIAAIISIRNNSGWGILVPCLMAFCNASIALLSLRYGEKILTKKDTTLLICAIITLVIWFLTKNDLLAIILVCTIDMIGFYFTWKKSYLHPFKEDLISYIMWTLELSCSFFAIEYLTLTNGLYPGLLAIVELFFVLFLLWRRHILKT